MTSDYKRFAQDVVVSTLAVGTEKIGVEEALNRLNAAADVCCDLGGIAELWQVAQKSSEVLRIAYPEYCAFFGNDDPRTPGDRPMPLDISTNVMIRLVLVGVATLDKDAKRKEGVRKILEAYPSLISRSDTPYVDERGLWDHTHGCAKASRPSQATGQDASDWA
jgi:hypothetical protein